jgi:hypothetical protein
MIMRIDIPKLKELNSHSKKLGLKRVIKNMGYERCAELPYIISKLESFFQEPLTYLDIGSGNSILPTFLLSKTKWNIHCLDKFKWVNKQLALAEKTYDGDDRDSRFHVILKDFMNTELPCESFDIITNISVVEHFEGNSDTESIKKSSKLLKSGGLYILTTLINEGYFKEFYVKKSVYGVKFNSNPVFYQKHYDVKQFEERIIKPSGLKEIERIYFGEYDYQFLNHFLLIPWPLKPVKVLYQWAIPFFAPKFITYRDYPVSDPNMDIFTASGVITILKKE